MIAPRGSSADLSQAGVDHQAVAIVDLHVCRIAEPGLFARPFVGQTRVRIGGRLVSRLPSRAGHLNDVIGTIRTDISASRGTGLNTNHSRLSEMGAILCECCSKSLFESWRLLLNDA